MGSLCLNWLINLRLKNSAKIDPILKIVTRIQHAQTFTFTKDGIFFEGEEDKTFSLGTEEKFSHFDEEITYSLRITEEKFCLLSYLEGENWVDIARSTTAISNRRKWVGIITIQGLHEITVFDDVLADSEKSPKIPPFEMPMKFESPVSGLNRENMTLATKLSSEINTQVIGTRKMIPDELIEIRIEKVNSDFVSSLEIGVTESGITDAEVCFSIRKGRLYKGSTPVSQQFSRLRTLKRGDRLGLVWRVKSSVEPKIGSVHLYLNGRELFEIVKSTMGSVFPFWILSGSVDTILLLPEEKRSHLWAPERNANNLRISLAINILLYIIIYILY